MVSIFMVFLTLKNKDVANWKPETANEKDLDATFLRLKDFEFVCKFAISKSYELVIETVIAPTAKSTVVALATALAGVRTSNHQMLPADTASHIPTYVAVPQDAVDSGKVTAVELVREALDAVPQFVLLFVKATLA